MTSEPRSSPAPVDRAREMWKLIAGWLVVGLPSAWGVAQVVVKSLALFE